MKKICILLVFIFYGVPVFAIPGRLQGFSYTGRIKPETDEFNARPASYDVEPTFPHYLNEDLSDARTNAPQNGDKYKLMPVYSMQELYDMQNGSVEYVEEDIDDEESFDEE